ncbi:MAG: hypothetical protein K5673_00975 [Lachnospiraceae bacterium]|nr:hypothetical protein [Lachnospiraceae bacterium]
MSKKMRKYTQLTVTAAVVLSVMYASADTAYAGGSTGSYYNIENEYHSDVNFADMEIQWVDEEAVETFLDQYGQAVKDGDEAAVVNGYDKLNALLDHVSTQYTLNDIRHNRDINNEEYAELSSSMLEFANDMSDRALQLIREALKSDAGDALKAHIDNEYLVEDLLEYEDMTDEEKKLDLEYQKLTQEYEKILISDTHVEVDGKDWNLDKLMNDYSLDRDGYRRIVTAIYRSRNSQMAQIYTEIVHNRNRIAEINGYDNYADYVYELSYNRDYTSEDVQIIYSGVQDYIVPLSEELSSKEVYNFKLMNLDLTADERMERVEPVIERIHPDLRYAWDYMRDHGLYDMDSSPSKMDTGYTVPLYTYGAPFIFDQPYGNWNDIQTVIHEFGHYNEMFHNEDMHVLTSVHNVDVSEIDSQGLELLCLDYADEIYGSGCRDAVVYELLSKMTDSVISGCIYDEFQYLAYTYDGELTPDVLNEMFCEVSNKYGNDYTPESAEVYYWPEINHTFEQPMYYISYCTSALAALDILAMSEHDRDAAVDCYMNLTTYHGEIPFRETLADVGLPDIFEEGVIEDISIAVREYAGFTPASKFLKMLKDPVLIIMAVILLVAAIVIIVVRASTRAERKAKKQNAGQMQMQ